ncbi:MAG: ABC transporter substrate-binding protein, partial [Gaiellaceae bacterium]
ATPFTDLRVRQAINLAIDREGLVKLLGGNAKPATGLMLPSSPWYGQPSFKFHVYTKIGEPDPDTGYDFGANRSTRKIIAWGGTTPDDEETGLGGYYPRRVWFYDLSAGPESWTDNWNVDDEDVDGDGVPDYRMPPIWEYLTPGGDRPAAQLDNDLGLVGRYVFLNLLATSSPLYPPYLTPPRQPQSINIDSNTFEGWSGHDASAEFIKPELLTKETTELLNTRVSYDNQDYPLTGKAAECFFKWDDNEPCFPQYPYPGFANLFLYAALNRSTFVDGGGEYEALFQNYASEGTEATPLGFADDNWIDGTQSFVFNFVDPGIVQAGYGLTTTQIHEGGHHWGMSHPHDGWDWETETDYGPGGPFYFAWSGDESNTMMSYIDVNWDFSQFDRDNYNRFAAAAYILNANAIAEDVQNSPNGLVGSDELSQADSAISAAERHFRMHKYKDAFESARIAYLYVFDGAAEAGVPVPASANGWYVLPPSAKAKKAKKLYAFDRDVRANQKRLDATR